MSGLWSWDLLIFLDTKWNSDDLYQFCKMAKFPTFSNFLNIPLTLWNSISPWHFPDSYEAWWSHVMTKATTHVWLTLSTKWVFLAARLRGFSWKPGFTVTHAASYLSHVINKSNGSVSNTARYTSNVLGFYLLTLWNCALFPYYLLIKLSLCQLLKWETITLPI